MHSKNTSYRPDIDGLRAVAVLLVLLFHFDLGVSGGFIGVDVFFVISGFLITEVIRNSINAKRFSFGNFYIRRLLRLHPALLVTVALSLLAGFLLMDPASFSGLAESAKYSIFSASNFYFWLNQGYFDAAAQTQPLLHTWSLAAEWQFYLVWPFIVWGALKISDRFLLILLAVMTVASLAASQIMLGYDSSASYFMMPFRVFELSIGAMLVFISRHRASPTVESALTCFGLAMIVGSAFLLDSSSPFPGVRALIPCLGAAACIYAGRSQAGKVLAFKPMVLIGLISYSVYLVHWPVLVFYKYYFFREISDFEKVGLCLFSIAFGALIYYSVEKVFMGSWKSIKPVGISVIAISVAALAFATNTIVDGEGLKSRVPENLQAFTSDPVNFHTNNYGGHGYPLSTVLGNSKGKLSAVIAGDSYALQYASGIDQSLKNSESYIYGVFKHGCVISRKYTRLLSGKPRGDCFDTYNNALKALSNNSAPLIYALRWQGYEKITSDKDGKNSVDANKSYISVLTDMLQDIRKDIGDRDFIIIGGQPTPPNRQAASSCILRPVFVKQICQDNMTFQQDTPEASEINFALKKFANDTPRTFYVDAKDAICQNGKCSSIKDGEVLYSDDSHFSIDGSVIAAKVILSKTYNLLGLSKSDVE